MYILLKLTPKFENIDYTELVVKIANNQDVNFRDYEVAQISDVVLGFKDEIEEYLLEHGYSSLVNSELILEHLVSPGTPENKIIRAVHRYLDKIGIDDELIIIDPYFLVKTADASMIFQILSKYLDSIDNLTIITLPDKVDTAVQTEINAQILRIKPTININYQTTLKIHDRYWISNKREKGVIMGTSLNGLGKKYALIDRLNTSDVRSIINGMESEGVL